jgi:hypothetical protein
MLHQRLRAGPNVLSKKSDHRHRKKQRIPKHMQITIAHQVLDFDQSL